MTVIKAIETQYRGHLFRSRLEARWAVFFDRLKITWQYEPQGFVIQPFKDDESRNYLPDFYLPDLDIWVEVKGDPAGVDWPLWGCAVDAWSYSHLPDSRHAYSGEGGNGSALLILGSIPPDTLSTWCHPLLVNEKGVSIQAATFLAHDDLGVVARHGTFESTWHGFQGHPLWYDTKRRHHRTRHAPDHNGYANDRGQITARVYRAYKAARQARFEHGRQG